MLYKNSLIIKNMLKYSNSTGKLICNKYMMKHP